MQNAANAPRVMIATPTPGKVATVFMKTIIATMHDLSTNGVYSRFDTFDAADLPMQRNILATRFYESDCTHLFMVDSDMMFQEVLCRTLLESGKPFVGTITATKQFYISRVASALEKGLSMDEAVTFASDWIAFPMVDSEKIEVENGLMKVAGVGFGAVLISRPVLDIMISRAAVKRQERSKANEHLGAYYNFFTLRAEQAAANQHTSEDASFCDRWRLDCGGTIWAFVNTPIIHIGDFGYGGSYFDHLQVIAKLQSKEP